MILLTQTGKSPRNVYKDAVTSASNPLNASVVPSKRQIKYIASSIRKQDYPFAEVYHYSYSH